MKQYDWVSDPKIRTIDIRKLTVLMALMNQVNNKSFSEMIPDIIEANKNLSSMNLSFTPEEIQLIFDALKQDMSVEEINQLNKLKSLINLPIW